MSILEAGERAMGAEIEQRIDAALDMPALEVSTDPEVITGDDALNKILTLGIAARSWRKDVLIFRQDARLLHGTPIQDLAVDILKHSAAAGVDRIQGETYSPSPYHVVYDKLFEKAPEANHVAFREKLSTTAYAIANLMNDRDSFELTVEERQGMHNMRNWLMRATNGIFTDYFLEVASSSPEEAEALLTQSIDPMVASHFLAQDHFEERYLLLTSIHTSRPDLAPEINYLSWVRDQTRRLQALRLGRVATR